MKSAIIKIFVGIILFSTGIIIGGTVCHLYEESPAAVIPVPMGMESVVENMRNENPVDEILLRVRDGNVEWYDGVRWNNAGAVKELALADPIAQPSEEWQALAARLADARAEENAVQLAALSRESGSLLVDEIVIARPKTNTSAVTPPAASAASQTTVPADSGSQNNDNNDDRYNHENTPEPEPAAPAPTPEPAPEPDPEPDDTGDGENIEWSGDYE